jgi:hypothetical protein
MSWKKLSQLEDSMLQKKTQIYRYMEMAAFQTIRDKNPDAVFAQADIGSKLFHRQLFHS